MELERLRTIIAYSDKNREDIYSMVKRFCSFAGIEYDSALLNVLQIARSSLKKKGYLVFEMPFADDEMPRAVLSGSGLNSVCYLACLRFLHHPVLSFEKSGT